MDKDTFEHINELLANLSYILGTQMNCHTPEYEAISTIEKILCEFLRIAEIEKP